MNSFYINNEFAGHSFLKLVKNESLTIQDINFESVLQFLSLGYIYFNETLLFNVKKANHFQKHFFISENKLTAPYTPKTTLTNNLDTLSNSFISKFEVLKHLNYKNISIDITGGIDSRLVAVVLDHFDINYDAQFNISSSKLGEIDIVNNVASTLNIPLHIVENGNLTSDILDTLFYLSDAQIDLLNLQSLYFAQRERQKRNIDLIITGVAGELYKDFWWQQDFPFYTKKKSNLEKLYTYRMYPYTFPDNWKGKRILKTDKSFKSSFIEKLNSYQKETNSNTYDNIYLNVRMAEIVSSMSNATEHFISVYNPLLEPELLSIGYSLKRRDRFFNNFHRHVITNLNPAIAKIRTTEGGISVSNQPFHVLNDILKYGSDKVIKVVNKIKPQNKLPQSNAVNSIIESKVLNSIVTLQKAEILSASFPNSLNQIPKPLWGRLLTLAYLIEYMDVVKSK